MATNEECGVKELEKGTVFLSENTYSKLMDITMNVSLLDTSNVGFMFGRKMDEGTIYLEQLVTDKDLMEKGRKDKESKPDSNWARMLLGLKSKISKNPLQNFVACSINVHSSFEDYPAFLRNNHLNMLALKKLAHDWNRFAPTACISLFIGIDFTEKKETIGFYCCDDGSLYRFPNIYILKIDGEITPIISGSGTQR
jgi:hypothetical protein